jgi:predicted anti-sigma-YlaC factor YlaD
MRYHNNIDVMSWIKGMMFKHIRGMLPCQEFEDFILSYFENTLPEIQQKKFKRHLRLCKACRQYIHAYQKTIELSQSTLSAPFPEDDIPEDLIKMILKLRDR